MLSRLGLYGLLTIANAVHATTNATAAMQTSILASCIQIAAAVSEASNVYYPPSPQYIKDITHYAVSSSQTSVCSVEPGTAEDVGIILRILGSNQTPFGVKGGGHMMNPGAASTPGVELAMSRFSEVTYDGDTQSATIGAGLLWDDVYSVLEQFDVNVVGGRVSGIGIAGFTLGGGYSWKTNQYGLTLDTVQAYELVLPNGSVWDVTGTAHPDLFFGLKGGYNNFGIVTQFTLSTFPQTEVWGGQVVILQDYAAQVRAATLQFTSEVTDPKAAMLINIIYIADTPLIVLNMFYDAPAQPAGIFDEFLAIPSVSSALSTRSYLSVVQAAPTNTTAGYRGLYGTVPVLNITPAIFDAMLNETQYWATQAASLSIIELDWALEPFLPSILTHGSPSAYPPTRNPRFLPININVLWTDAADDAAVQALVAISTALIKNLAIKEGQAIQDAPEYPNYAAARTPVEAMYGANLPRLSALRKQYDPEGVMTLAGGWKF